MKTTDVCREHGISSPTFYAWKAKYGGMDVPHPRRGQDVVALRLSAQ